MGVPSGLVPIHFRTAGLLLIVLGGAGLLFRFIAWLAGWAVPTLLLPASVAILIVGLYLYFTLRTEGDPQQ